ncbi:TetR/AcrR family transcriptional regulator [Cellulomonas sp. URHB0016]
MAAPESTVGARRSGAETRSAIQRAALELFTTQGYQATSMREIADALGIKKASLYYHFAGKDDIVRSLFVERGHEAEALLEWIADQPRTPDLPKAAVLRWVDTFSTDKLRGIRFVGANPLLMSAIAGQSADRIGSALTALVDALAPLLPDGRPDNVLQLRMALLSINAAVYAAAGDDFTEGDIVAAARHNATAVMDSLRR